MKTSRNTYHTSAVVLCIGRRGTPRTLGVPGEELTKVVYRLIDPDQYRGRHVLVVGGGDSALEAAISIGDEQGTDVTLSYRGDGFGRAKPKNRERIDDAVKSGRLRLLLNSNVSHITDTHVAIVQGDATHELRNDAVIVCAGGVLPTPFLKKIGIEVETKYGTA